MRYFIAGKESFKRSVEVLLILSFLFFGLYLYNDSKNFIYHFKPYYLQAHLDAYQMKKKIVPSSEEQGDIKYADSVPVLIYHGILANVDEGSIEAGEGVNVTLKTFEDQMLSLKNSGWQTVSIDEFRDFMKFGKRLPEKSFLLSFDDGRKDSYYPADPILKALGYRATMFVISGKSLTKESESSNFYLSGSEIQEMLRSSRWDIQSHGAFDHDMYEISSDSVKGHFLGNKIWNKEESRLENDDEFRERIVQDLSLSKETISGFTSKKVFAFAYPFDDYGNQSQNYEGAEPVVLSSVSSIYQLAFYQIDASNGFGFNYPGQDSFMVKRIKFRSDTTGDELVTYLSKSMSKKQELSYDDEFNQDNGWFGNWGSAEISNGSLSVGANEKTTGGMVLLDGSQLWKDINLKAVTKSIRGESISIVSRFLDNKNYLACTLTDKYIRLEQIVNGQKNVLDEYRFLFFSDVSNIGIKVSNQRADCFVNDEVLASGEVDSSIQMGAIGFKTWDAEIGKSRLEIESLTVGSQ